MILHPRNFSAAYVGVYVIRNNSLTLVHKTPVEDVPLAICPFYGKVLIGVGKLLRIYELGKAKLLKKCENKVVFPSLISSIKVDGERIFATDISESHSVLRWKREDNQLYCFADDVVPRWVTASCILDHDTIAAVDKFENFYVVRVPAACAEDEDDPGAVKYKWESGYLNGAYYKMDHIVHYYIGDMATCIQKTRLSDSSNEVLIYGTTMGAIGVFLPITNKDDVEFFVHLEMYMRIESPSICGRDHMSFRSFYQPVKDVVDGDLCEQFVKMEYSRQRNMSEQLERTPNEILKKLEEFRNRIL